MQRKPSLPRPFFVKKSRRGILLLHAYSGSSNDVRMLSRILEKNDYTVSAPILTGHGTFEPLDILAASVEDWRQDARQAFLQLRKECEEVAIFGLSMGGILAMDLLEEEHPESIGGGLFCSPLFKTENQVPENFFRYAEQVYQTVGLDPVLQAEKLGQIRELVGGQLQAIEALGEQVAKRLSLLQVPIYLAQGGKDEMIAATTVYQTLKALPQTDVSLHWFAESGHVITVDPVHKQFEATVLNFIENLPWNEEK